MSTRAKVAVTYVTVLALMLAWWSALEASASVGPILLVTVAYLAPVAIWVFLWRWGHPAEEQGP